MHKLTIICLFVVIFLTIEVKSQPEAEVYDRRSHEIKLFIGHGKPHAPELLTREEEIKTDLKNSLRASYDRVKSGLEETTLREKMNGKSVRVAIKLNPESALVNSHIIQSSGSTKLDKEILELISKSDFQDSSPAENQTFVIEFPSFRVKQLL